MRCTLFCGVIKKVVVKMVFVKKYGKKFFDYILEISFICTLKNIKNMSIYDIL